MNETLIKDLMTKLNDDAKSALHRVLELYATTVPKDQLADGAVNIVRAGMTPFLRELLGLAPPEQVLASIAMQIIYMSRIDNGKRNMLTQKDTSNAENLFMQLVATPLKQEIER